MMSDFNFCPICGVKRENNIRFCPNCNFEFLFGNYVKVEDIKENKLKKSNSVQVEKISQEEFVEANDFIKNTRDKINSLIASYLNSLSLNQFNEKYIENLSFDLYEYISNNLNMDIDYDFEALLFKMNGDLEKIDTLINAQIVLTYRKRFIQWIDENRSHLPGMVLNQYKLPIQNNINALNKILLLDFDENNDNLLFIELLNKYLDIENQFLEKLI